ncbi:hypothetical protein F2Q69_00047987 [Brassica cretica]|uniref:Uncharacterized protein n=1 Tax=Brassica cretica TaxID=69181 RepID=A0A8S9PLC4_BRACR|nr:hypothetical protein F2Q69_00047987 [Brassica cretica]
MAKRDEQHVSGELSRVEEAGTEDTTSTSTDGMTSTSIDSTISMSTNFTTSTSLDCTTSTSIDVTTSSSIDNVDREVTMEDSLELEEWLEDMDQNLKKKLDGDQHTSRGDLETSKASIGRHQPDEIDRQPPHIIDLHPPDIDRHSQPLIDRHHPPNIDRCPLLDVTPGCIIEMEPIEERMYMSKASHLDVPKYQRPPIWTEEAARFHKRVKRMHDPVKFVVSCAVFEADSPIPPDKGVHLSSYIDVLDDHQHAVASQRGLRCRGEVDKNPGEAASIITDQIPSIDTNTSPSIDTTTSPSIDTTISSSIDTGRVSEQKKFDVCGNLRDGDTTTRSDKFGGKKRRNWKKRKMIMGDSQLSLIPHFSDGVRKSRVREKDPRKTSLHEDRRCLRNIDRQSITSIDRSPLKCVDRQSFKSIDRHLTVLVGTHIKFSKRLPSVSTDANLSTSIDIALPALTDINILTSVDIHSGLVYHSYLLH